MAEDVEVESAIGSILWLAYTQGLTDFRDDSTITLSHERLQVAFGSWCKHGYVQREITKMVESISKILIGREQDRVITEGLTAGEAMIQERSPSMTEALLKAGQETMESWPVLMETMQGLVAQTMSNGWTDAQARELVLSMFVGKRDNE